MIARNNPKKLTNNTPTTATASGLPWYHWLVIGLSILLTLSAWLFSMEQQYEKDEIKFEREAERLIRLVKDRMELYENALWSGVAFHDANKTINHQLWHDYAQSLHIGQKYPGINGLGIIYNIKPEQLEDYLFLERQTRPDYTIHPQHEEDEYWPITYIEPSESNKKAVGLDMAFETNRYTAIKKARDSGLSQITEPIVLVQDSKRTAGFLFYAPFYKNGEKPATVGERQRSIKGVSYAPFIMNKLINQTLANQNLLISFNILDGKTTLFNLAYENAAAGIDRDPLFEQIFDVDMYGRSWQFDIRSNLDFRNNTQTYQPLFSLIGGGIINLLLVALFLRISRAKQQAVEYADNVNKELLIKTKHLEKSNQDLEQFSYIASHDLKSPLNAIQQLVTWIEEDCKDVLPSESKKHLALLKSRTHRMMKLLSDLLDYSRISRFEYENKEVNLRSMVDNIFDMLGRPPNASYTVTDCLLKIPETPLDIVLRNLISNSIKHHDEEMCTIEVHYEQQGLNHLIVVKDDGPGIPENMHTKVFEMFQTLKPRDQVEGSGMGLAIVKKIIEHHHGHLTISDNRPRGTTFTISWPIR